MSLESLRHKLEIKKDRVNLRYRYYEMKNLAADLRISTPPNLEWLHAVLGWNAKAVDTLADRLVFMGFKTETDFFNLNQIYQLNNLDVMPDSAFNAALIGSCSFIAISSVDDYPRMEAIDAANATGEIDARTGLLTEGYAVLKRDHDGQPRIEAYYEPGKTTYLENGRIRNVETVSSRYPALVPIIYRPDARRRFGHSRISRACMAITASALRTIKRSEIAAEFFSFPQRYVTGTDNDAELLDKWKATMSSLLEFGLNEDGQDHVKVGQFAQQSMTPHVEQLKMFAALYAGETGLTLDDLGFATENPSSAEAIKSAHENLRLTASKARRTFGAGLLNAGLVAASIRDGQPYDRMQLYETKLVWRPLFEPDATMLGAIGDGLSKLETAFPDAITRDVLTEFIGL